MTVYGVPVPFLQPSEVSKHFKGIRGEVLAADEAIFMAYQAYTPRCTSFSTQTLIGGVACLGSSTVYFGVAIPTRDGTLKHCLTDRCKFYNFSTI